YLAERFRYHDRATWTGEAREGRLLLDGEVAAPDAVARTGAILVYRKPHREPPIDRSIRLIHQDADIAVVDKPAQLRVHADGPFLRHVLIHLLRTECGIADATLVHRLDRETSGLVVVARSRTARRHLESQFATGTVEKEYLAVVHGIPPGPFCCRQPIGHAADSKVALRRSAAADARNPKAARTEFGIEERGPCRTLLRCRPHTGRTHQIRVHLEHCGFPIVGDKLYGRSDDDYLGFVQAVKAGADARTATDGRPSRQLLHAASLTIRHPVGERSMTFFSPLPDEFRRWLVGLE
ncbi:MAG: RluA family pseudouridine synthase, partial [Planctomycetes bacterium]|nr:RluA family pseudouridine synthase [Planctomycetota bacterium]